MILTGLLTIVVVYSIGGVLLIEGASETCGYYYVNNGLLLNVSEGTPVGTVVFQFSQTIGGGSSGPFTVTQNSVIVTSSTILQRGQATTYNVLVSCTDTSSHNILIIINIVNLYSALSPVWTPGGTNGVVTLVIPEFSAVASRVFSALADDPNVQSSYVICSYQFNPPTLSQYFSVTARNSTGVCYAAITIAQMFDYEILQSANITLTASITASQNQTVATASSLTVAINIQDKPNRAPVFVGSPYYATVKTIGAQTIFANVSAVDGNAGLNGPVTISVVACSQTPSPFSNVVSSGNVYATSPLTWANVYYLVLQASLNAAPWLNNYTWVQVTVAQAPTTTSTTTTSTTTGTTPPMTLVPCSATGSTQTLATSVPVLANLRPVFSATSLNVVANAPVGYQVANLANSLSLNSNCSFASLAVLAGGAVYTNYSLSYILGTPDFSVNAASGLLTVANPLNDLVTSAYVILASVVLTTQNTTLGSSSALLNVTVLLADESTPMVDSSTANVSVVYSSLSLSSGLQKVGQLSVTDPDVNGSLTYASFDYTGTFSVTNDGYIWLVSPSNVLPDTTYRFLVTVSDNWWPQPRVVGVSASVYIGPTQTNGQVQLASLGWIVFGAIGGTLFIVLLAFTILAIKQKHPVTWTADNARPSANNLAQNPSLSNVQAYENAAANFAIPLPPPSQVMAAPTLLSPSHIESKNNLVSPSGSINTSRERLMSTLSPPPVRPLVTRASVQFTEETSDLESPYDQVYNRPPTVLSESGVGLQYVTLESAKSGRNGSVLSALPNGNASATASASGTINQAFSKPTEG